MTVEVTLTDPEQDDEQTIEVSEAERYDYGQWENTDNDESGWSLNGLQPDDAQILRPYDLFWASGSMAHPDDTTNDAGEPVFPSVHIPDDCPVEVEVSEPAPTPADLDLPEPLLPRLEELHRRKEERGHLTDEEAARVAQDMREFHDAIEPVINTMVDAMSDAMEQLTDAFDPLVDTFTDMAEDIDLEELEEDDPELAEAFRQLEDYDG